MDTGLLIQIIIAVSIILILGIPIYYISKTRRSNAQFHRMEALTKQYNEHVKTCFSHILLHDTERRYKEYMMEFSKNAKGNGYNSFIQEFETCLHNQKTTIG